MIISEGLKEIFKRSMTLHHTKYFSTPIMEEENGAYKMVQGFTTLINDLASNLDDAILTELSRVMEEQRIGTAVIFNLEYVKKLMAKCTPANVDYISFACFCPSCGQEILPDTLYRYCPYCGKALIWNSAKH